MKATTGLKLKFAAGAVLAVLLPGDAASLATSQTSGDNLTAQEIAGKSRDAYAALSSYRDSGTAVSEMAGQKNTLTFKTRLQRPNREIAFITFRRIRLRRKQNDHERT